MSISAIIITYNEEENIRACLESIKWVDEIIVVDSFSSDKTISICKEYTNKIFTKKWEGFGPQKEYARSLATYDWLLSIDADERLTNELKDEILKNPLDKDAYYIPRRFYWLSREMKYGGCKERHIRLFRKEKACFSNEHIHEKVIVNGEIGHLKNPILHFSYKDIEDYWTRLNLYTTLSSIEKFNKGKKAYFWQFLFLPLDFCIRYFLKLGFLDGVAGFLYAAFSSFHRFVKYAKLWELRQKEKIPKGC